MAFVKGQQRPPGSGRKRGTPNKLSRMLYEGLHKQLEELNFNSLEIACRMVRSTRVPMEVRARLLAVILQLQFPRMQSVAITKHQTQTQRITLIELMKDPALAKSMETLSFALEGKRAEQRLLPAPSGAGLPILDGETEDLADPPRATGLAL